MKRLIKSAILAIAILICVAQPPSAVQAQQLDLKWTKGNLPTSRISAQGVGGLCLETDGNGGVQLAPCSSGGGTGTVTSFSSGNLAPLFTTSVTNSTSTPSLAFTLTNAAAHTFFGNTSGVSAAPSYSAITAADLPGSITSSTSGNAATASALAANPADCAANNFAISIDAGGNLSCAQVAYSQVSGTPTLPANTTATAHQFFTAYNSATGAFTKAQPAYADISGTPVLAASITNAVHKWLNSYDATTGLFTQTQPDYSDLTGLPTLPASKTCLGTDKVSAYDSTTGLFTCSTDQTASGAGSGTVTSFSAGTLSPLFTTSVATATTTPALSFALSNASAHAFLGNNTASSAAPAYVQPASTDLADFSPTAASSAGQIPIFDGSKYVPGDPLVQGLFADGSTSVANPVIIGGYDTAATPAQHRSIFLNGSPAGTEYGLVTRPIPSGTQTISGSISVSNFPATQPVSGTVTANAGSGTFAISAASLPLPSGAATSAKQPALGTAGTPSADVITVQGAASMTAVKVDGSAVTQPVSGTVAVSNFPATQPVSGTVAVSNFPATQPVSGTVTANQGGTWTVQPGNTPNTTPWVVEPPGATPILANALSTTVKTVSAGAAILDSYYCANPNTTAEYVQIFDIAGTVTLGTSTPKWSIRIPPNDGAANLSGVNLNFTAAIKVAATTTATGSTAPTTALDCNFGVR